MGVRVGEEWKSLGSWSYATSKCLRVGITTIITLTIITTIITISIPINFTIIIVITITIITMIITKKWGWRVSWAEPVAKTYREYFCHKRFRVKRLGFVHGRRHKTRCENGVVGCEQDGYNNQSGAFW